MHILARLVNGEVIEQNVDSNICVIGRSSKCDVVIPHEGMSRQHCQIEVIDGEYFVTDLGSTNGVLIDNQKIEPHQKIPYQTFLTLSFGAVQNLQVDEESHREVNAGIDGVSGGVSSDGNPVSSLTRTKTMKSSPAREYKELPPPLVKDEKAAKLRLIISAIAALLLIGGAVAWYAFQEDEVKKEGFELIDEDPIEFKGKPPVDQF